MTIPSSSSEVRSATEVMTSGRPLLLPGLVSSWPACTRWKLLGHRKEPIEEHGDRPPVVLETSTISASSPLQHLRAAAGSAEVQVMESSSEVFLGDLYSHKPTTMRFDEFLDAAERYLSQPSAAFRAAQGTLLPHQGSGDGVPEGREKRGGKVPGGGSGSGPAPDPGHGHHRPPPGPFLYLAQHPLSQGMTGLEADISTPSCLDGRTLTSHNLWTCIGGSRSGLHYDPQDNLLCVVTGKKTVTLFSPGLTPCLYPRPITDESSNHSLVNFADPDIHGAHPKYRRALEGKLTATLLPGDALFIPSGWWHQVDSQDLTMAVNFWFMGGGGGGGGQLGPTAGADQSPPVHQMPPPAQRAEGGSSGGDATAIANTSGCSLHQRPLSPDSVEVQELVKHQQHPGGGGGVSGPGGPLPHLPSTSSSYVRLREVMGESIMEMMSVMTREVQPLDAIIIRSAQAAEAVEEEEEVVGSSREGQLQGMMMMMMKGEGEEESSGGRQGGVPPQLSARERAAVQVLVRCLSDPSRPFPILPLEREDGLGKETQAGGREHPREESDVKEEAPPAADIMARCFQSLECQQLARVLLHLSLNRPDLIRRLFFGRPVATTAPSDPPLVHSGSGSPLLSPLAAYLLTTKLEGLEEQEEEGVHEEEGEQIAQRHLQEEEQGGRGEAMLVEEVSGEGPATAAGTGRAPPPPPPAVPPSLLYPALYGATGDPEGAFEVLLRGRSALAEMAARRVLGQVLGL